MDEGRKRVIGIMAAILSAMHMQSVTVLACAWVRVGIEFATPLGPPPPFPH
jgi:hypothetical protein